MKLMLDEISYKNKPKDPGTITNRITNSHPKDIKIEELAIHVAQGKSFLSCALNQNLSRVTRSIDSWDSQDLICLDFDNGLNLDDAIEIFKDECCFIYTTFSHTQYQNKFRVVFKLSRTILSYTEFQLIMEHLIIKYPMCDHSCRDGTRLFYGGKNIIDICYNNTLNVDLILEDIETHQQLSRFTPSNTIYTYLLEGVKRFNHIDDAYKELYKNDISNYLNVNYKMSIKNKKSFKCIFHDDTNASASIYQDQKSGFYFYKCHGEKCSFVGNIVKVVQRIENIDRINAYNKLCRFYNIEVIETEWQKQQKERLEHNINYLTSGIMEIEYPVLYKKIKRNLPFLIMMNLIAKHYIGSETVKELETDVFFVSRSYISDRSKEYELLISQMFQSLEFNKISSDPKSITKKIDLLSFIGLIEKMHLDNVPSEMSDIAKSHKFDKKYKNAQNFYRIENITDENMENATHKIEEMKQNHVSMAGFGRESIVRNIGSNEANNVFPMMKDKQLNDRQEKRSAEFKKFAIRFIEEDGYLIESELLQKMIDKSILENGTISKNRHIATIKKNLNELIEGYNLQRERLTKDLKVEFKLDHIIGCPFILYKK